MAPDRRAQEDAQGSRGRRVVAQYLRSLHRIRFAVPCVSERSGIIPPVSDEQPFCKPGCQRTIAPLRPRLGEEVWRLRKKARTQTCELRHDEGASLGWDVQLLEDGELLYSHRCANEQRARFVATCFRQDYLRAGWTQ